LLGAKPVLDRIAGGAAPLDDKFRTRGSLDLFECGDFFVTRDLRAAAGATSSLVAILFLLTPS